MTQRELIRAHVEELFNFGETYMGDVNILGDRVIKDLKKVQKLVQKEVEERYPGKLVAVAFDIETGYAWLA